MPRISESVDMEPSVSSSMMEHHIPATVLDASKRFSTLIGPDGTQFVFSLGKDGIYRVSAEFDSGCSGWVTLDIAATLLSGLIGAQVKTFACSISAVNSQITMALVLQNSAGGDALYVANGLDSTSNAGNSWFDDDGKNIAWTPIPFDSQNPDTITSGNLFIFDVTLLLSKQDEMTETPYAHVEIVDQTSGSLYHRIFNVILPPTNLQPGDKAWSLLTLPFDANSPLQTAGGQPSENSGQGIYLLGKLQDTTTLDFIPQDTGDFTMRYSVPQTADAIASLVLPDQSTNTTITELYVTSDNQLTILRSGDKPSPPCTVVEKSSYIVGTTMLNVSTNYGEPNVDNDLALVNVFGINTVSDGKGGSFNQVYYTHALYIHRLDLDAWAPVCLILDQADAVAPVTNAQTGMLGFLGISSSPSVTGWTQYGNAPAKALVSMKSDPVSCSWKQHTLPIPTSSDYIRLRSYTSKIRLVDPATKIPLVNQEVRITTDSDTSILVNGLSTSCGPLNPTSVVTDKAGCISVCNAVSDLQAVRFTMTSTDGKALLDTHDPASTIQSSLASGMTGDLSNLTYQDGQGNNQKLVDTSIDPNYVQSASTALKNIDKYMPSKRSTEAVLTRGHALAARGRIARKRFMARKAAASLSNPQSSAEDGIFDGISMFFADLAQWAVSAAEEVTNAFVEFADGVVGLVIHFGEDIFHAVIDTVEDACGGSIVSVFKWIGAEFEKVFRWLAFIFNWAEMLKVHNGFSDAAKNGITTFAKELSTINTKLDGYIEDAKAKLNGSNPFSSMTSSVKSSASSSRPSSSTVNGTDVSTDPTMSWVGDQMKNSNSSSGAASIGKSRKAVLNKANKARSSLHQENDSTLSSVLSSLGSKSSSSGSSDDTEKFSDSVKGDSSCGDAMWNFIQAIGNKILDGFEDGVDAAFQLAKEIESIAEEVLTAEISIPVLSGIYKDLVGNPPSILDICCLCAAIVATIGYNIIQSTNNKPKHLSDYVTSDAFQGKFKNIPQKAVTLQGSKNKFTHLKDGSDADVAIKAVLGSIQVIKGISLIAGTIGEDFELQAVTSLGTIVELLCDIFTGCLGAVGSEENEKFADFIVVGTSARLVLLIALAQSFGRPGGMGGVEAKGICIMSDVVSFAVGVGAFVQICDEGITNASVEDWLDLFVDILALPEMIAAECKQSEILSIIGALRAFAAEGVGICFFIDATEVAETKAQEPITLMAAQKPVAVMAAREPVASKAVRDPVTSKAAEEPQTAPLPTASPQTTTQKTKYRSGKIGGTATDATTLSLNHVDMAFTLHNQVTAEIAKRKVKSTLLALSFSYSTDFQPVASNPAYSCSGTLNPKTTTSLQLSCGDIGETVGSGVLWNYSISEATAVINGNTYSNKGAAAWVVPLVVQSYQRFNDLSAQPSEVAKKQQQKMKETYSKDLQTCDYGLDFRQTSLPDNVHDAPPKWSNDDWTFFCKAVNAFLNLNVDTFFKDVNTRIPLVEGVVPGSSDSSPPWNLGPTSWSLFNLPPTNSNAVGAVILAFMVHGNAMPSDPTIDFDGAALFPFENYNGVLFVSLGLTSDAVFQHVCPPKCSIGLASIGMNMMKAPSEDAAEAFGRPGAQLNIAAYQIGYWAPDLNAIDFKDFTPKPNSKPLKVDIQAIKSLLLDLTDPKTNNTIFTTTMWNATTITVALDKAENGFYQSVTLKGKYNVSKHSVTLHLPKMQTYGVNDGTWTVGATANLQVSGNTASFIYDTKAESLSSKPDPSLTSDLDCQSWSERRYFGYTPFSGADEFVINFAKNLDYPKHPSIDKLARDVLYNDEHGFCRTAGQANGQVNIFVFPGSQDYQMALAGINKSDNMVVKLTYTISEDEK